MDWFSVNDQVEPICLRGVHHPQCRPDSNDKCFPNSKEVSYLLLRDKKKKLDSMMLSEYLDKYAETGKEYVRILQQIIRQNQLSDFDDAKLLPSSIELESLI